MDLETLDKLCAFLNVGIGEIFEHKKTLAISRRFVTLSWTGAYSIVRRVVKVRGCSVDYFYIPFEAETRCGEPGFCF
ncbi:MAG: helix-turn-helix transcriptional regulator [Desulfitobacterium hafniense]|nr:helix-turn-helix transcriptional regulator [Desulfitobacterium hafniense]